MQLDVGNPLQLTKTMRARLLAAVRALVSAPALEGACDASRLASVVLMAKARVAAGYSTEIRAGELGRWLGLTKSRVAHTVLPELRERGMLGSNATTSANGRATGLECWVIPMYRAQQAGDRRHALALSRVELAVLLRLVEVLFGPGWTRKDGSVTPAGLLADRTGRGAATDRLGLLLMVLSSNSRGWLQLCSGSVDAERGRPAATVGRLLGCSPATGANVLKRLQEHGVLEVERRETASGLNARSRVRLLPVAQAHGVLVREAREATGATFSDLAGTASGDHEPAGEAAALAVTGVEGTEQVEEAGSADLVVAAPLHASHAPVVTPVSSLSLSGGFSGEGRGAKGRRPERAGAREDGLVRAGRPESTVAGGEGALRAEGPTPFPLSARIAALVPGTARLLAEVVGTVTGFQRGRLDRLVKALVADGETDAMIVARLRQRLAPLATRDSARPYTFRRDGLSWALSIGLPYRPGGLLMLPCRNRWCCNAVLGRATDSVRCDDCEVAAWEAAQRPDPADVAPPPPLEVLRAQIAAPRRSALPAAGHAQAPAGEGPGQTAPTMPASVREQIGVIAGLDARAGRLAEEAALSLYGGEAGDASSVGYRDRVSAAMAVFTAITSRYADAIAAYYAGRAA
ncbi:hypothetical protein [Streptomyces roseoverticillatus]|uniref:hypothetical protein n=1 Tax=Streptomyces roseoverticillatus TaxID=66429 RepID=UPI001F42DFA9|nr:hypothetical protein [Streptomyces roseoverticillatus]